MKKCVKVLLGMVCAVSMLSCVACGGGSSGSKDTGDNGKQTKKTEEEFIAAINATVALENVTVETVDISVNKKEETTIKMDGNKWGYYQKNYENDKIEKVYEAYIEFNTDVMRVYEQASAYSWRVEELPSNASLESAVKEEFSNKESVKMFIDVYDALTFNDETGAYEGTELSLFDGENELFVRSLALYFTETYLYKVEMSGGEYYSTTITFFDYGETEVKLPSADGDSSQEGGNKPANPEMPDGYTEVENFGGALAEQAYNDIMTALSGWNDNYTYTTKYDVICKIKDSESPIAIEYVDKVDGENLYECSCTKRDSNNATTLQVWYIKEIQESGSPSATAYAQKNDDEVTSANVSWAEICASLNLPSDRIFNPIYDFSGYSFSDVSFYVDEDSDDETDLLSYFTLFIKGEAAVEFVKTMMDFNVEGAKITASDIEYSFVLTDKGELDHIEIYCTVNMKYQGIAVEYVFDGDIVFSDIGTTVVTAPGAVTVQ